MQDSLRNANLSQPGSPSTNQPFSGGVWSGQSWLLAAASISTVALIAFSVWQHREINQLRQTVGQLHQQPVQSSVPTPTNSSEEKALRPDVAQSSEKIPPKLAQDVTTSANRNEGQGIRPDTVYITRYVATPSQKRSEQRTEEQLSQRTETPTEPRYATEKPIELSTPAHQSTQVNKNNQTEPYDVSSTPSVATNTFNKSGATNKLTNPSSNDRSRLSQNTRERRFRDIKRSSTSPVNLVDSQRNVAVNTPAIPTESSTNAVPQKETMSATNDVSATYESAASLPLSIEPKNWNLALAQRAKRMRPTQPTVAVVSEPAKAVAEPASSRPAKNLAVRFRAGIGGEVSSRLWNAGIVTEILIGRHWTLGLGLTQATSTNRFVTDEDFNNRTHRDFRKEFAYGIDPWREIMNIDTRQVRLQIPVNLGYRIPLNSTLSILPTVGTYVNLSNNEDVTYYCRQFQFPPQKPLYKYEERGIQKTQPVNFMSNLVLGVGLDWQRGHWAAQASPVLSIPTQTNSQTMQTDLSWQNTVTLGARARLLYQF